MIIANSDGMNTLYKMVIFNKGAIYKQFISRGENVRIGLEILMK